MNKINSEDFSKSKNILSPNSGNVGPRGAGSKDFEAV